MTMDTRRCIQATLIAFCVCVCSCSLFVPDTGPPPKPGQCPRFLYTYPSRLGCSEDQDCLGDHKCCPFNCGSVCVSPVFTKILCPDQSGTGTCMDLCSDDSDCHGGKKCCYNGCGHECMIPKTVKPGFCGFPPLSPCGNSCSDDSNCSGDDKCCPSFCGHFCKTPL